MITHCNWQTKTYSNIQDYLPSANPLKILMTSGASCPDAIVEQVIRKLAAFYDVEDKVDEFIQLYS